jgi:flavin reductase (DIM6/NTAB) family NADH-FMN oxidoreductase RutF
MHLTKEDIQNTERIKRLNIINSITGIKPANLIGTISGDGKTNLAIFSSVIHLGSNPALIGFILRPDREAGQHTFDNIKENGFYTINHIHESFTEQAHYTSAKFGRDESEFDACALTEEYIADFIAPFIKESTLKLGMKMVQIIPIELNGTVLIIGEVEHLIIPDAAMDEQGQIDLSQPNDVGISGLNTYYKLEKIAQFPYARPNALPDFSKENV